MLREFRVLTKIVVCIYDAFEDNFGIERILGKYLKEYCRWNSKEQFSFNLISLMGCTIKVRKIQPTNFLKLFLPH